MALTVGLNQPNNHVLSSTFGGTYKVTSSNEVLSSVPDFQKMRTTRNFW